MQDSGVAAEESAGAAAAIARILENARRHLGMQVAFVAEFNGDNRTIRNVSADGTDAHELTGRADAIADTYCAFVADGSMTVVRDTSRHAQVRDLPITEALGIGSYAGAPIYLSSGDVYGTLCCFSDTPEPSLNERDVQTLRMLASLIATEIESEEMAALEQLAQRERMQDIIDSDRLSVVFQPVVNLSCGRVVGYEALARFDVEPRQGPDVWFDAARRAGLHSSLEAKAIGKALARLPELPAEHYLAVNVSDTGLCSAEVRAALSLAPPDRVVIELTEHTIHEDGHALSVAMADYRERGFRFAMDDLGAGHAGLERLLRLAPEVIKLDRALVRGIDADPARRALVSATVAFAESVGASTVAEGVETAGECSAVRALGVSHVQGYFLARPAPAPWDKLSHDARLLAPAATQQHRANMRTALMLAAVTLTTYVLAATFDVAERLHVLTAEDHAIQLDEIPLTLSVLALALSLLTIRRAAAFQRQMDDKREAQQRLQHANAELWRMTLTQGPRR